ncbi:STAS domain-containing protein [Mycobacterium sp. pV006]|uniref:STAS domain-containing protein n=1 Tax=Mycobacterium sp. pV006 TaxID=3238983 RepID=UPI00351BDE57
MSTSLTVDTARQDTGELTVIASGEVDMSNVATFQQTLTAAAEATTGALTVDLSRVEYVDSAGINLLFRLADRISSVIAHPLLMTTFTVSGLTELVPVVPADS